MPSSADIAILQKLNKLALRYGLRATDTEAWLVFVDDDAAPDGRGYHALNFAGTPTDPEKAEKFGKFAKAIGMVEDYVKAPFLSDLEDILDNALLLAPRARAR